MSMLIYWIIIGAAAGYVGTKLLKIDLPMPQTIALGIVGALALRVFLAVLGVASGFIGAILGVAALVFLYKRFIEKK